MKARFLLPLVLLASAIALRAQEKAVPTAPAAAPASELGAPQPPAEKPNLTPAPLPAPASSGSKADPALDLIPAQPGQLTPAPAAAPSQATLGPQESMLSDHGQPGADERRRLKRTKAAPVGESKTEKVEQDLADLVRLRQAKTAALASDPSLITEYHAANERHTDLEKREALKKYYVRLYDRIRKIDPNTKKLADERQTFVLHRLTQARLTPTEALEEDQHVTTPYAGESFFGAQF
jgi:hypothetical protein